MEMKAAKGKKGLSAPLRKQRETQPQMFPWKIFRACLITSFAMWVFVIIARIFEMCHGESMLMKFSGRQVRWPSHVQPWVSPWTRRGRPDEMAHTGGSDRRLFEDDVAVRANRLMDSLGPLTETLRLKHAAAPAAGPAAVNFDISWPADLTPSLLASKDENLLAALSKNGKGAIVHLPSIGSSSSSPKSFLLSGVDQLGEMVGASWGPKGLLLSTSSGKLAECAGMPVSGTWPCREVGQMLPTGGSLITSATAGRVADSDVIRAAMASLEDATVTVFESVADGEWLPVGEVQFRRTDVSTALHLSFSKDSDEVVISSLDGSTMTWKIGATEPAFVASRSASSTRWAAACGLGRGRVAHLATSTGKVSPQLMVTSTL